MAPKFKDGDVLISFSGKWVSWAHTVVAYSKEQIDLLDKSQNVDYPP